MSRQTPSPSFLDPGLLALELIVTAAPEAVRSGEATMEQAILHAAVHGWYKLTFKVRDACPRLQLPWRAARPW
jgi:hypothetical protein